MSIDLQHWEGPQFSAMTVNRTEFNNKTFYDSSANDGSQVPLIIPVRDDDCERILWPGFTIL